MPGWPHVDFCLYSCMVAGMAIRDSASLGLGFEPISGRVVLLQETSSLDLITDLNAAMF